MLPCSCLIPWFVFIALWSFDSCKASPSPPPGICLGFCDFHVWPMMGLWSVLCDIKLNSFFRGQDVLPPWHFLLSVMSLLISLSEALYLSCAWSSSHLDFCLPIPTHSPQKGKEELLFHLTCGIGQPLMSDFFDICLINLLPGVCVYL
jgi:hypothetical protein